MSASASVPARQRFPLAHRHTPATAARYLNRAEGTLEGWRRDGIGPRFYRTGPGPRARIFYLQEDLDAWLASMASPHGPTATATAA